MLKYRHTYRDEGSFTAWMYHLARRCATRPFPQVARRPRSRSTRPISRSTPTSRAAPTSPPPASDDHALLHRALGRLDRDDREVLLLSRLQELSFAEVAAILECSVGAARVRAHRALRSLRDQYFRLQKEPLT